MESQRQKKISSLIQKDISNIIQSFFRDKTRSNFLVSITKVKVSQDLSLSKIYLSVFPSINNFSVLEVLNKNKFNRDCLLIGLGGGITTDMVGFVAASYLRGVDSVSYTHLRAHET